MARPGCTISPVPFAELGFRTDLGATAVPERTRDFLTAVPLVLVGWPAALLALRQATAPREEAEMAVPPVALPALTIGRER